MAPAVTSKPMTVTSSDGLVHLGVGRDAKCADRTGIISAGREPSGLGVKQEIPPGPVRRTFWLAGMRGVVQRCGGRAV